MGKVVEHLPSKHWALSSPHYSQKKFFKPVNFLKRIHTNGQQIYEENAQ
jgi:hypothetical protein